MTLWDRVLGFFYDTTPEGRAFDARWGTETSGFDWGNYEPTVPSVVHAALDAVDLGPEGVSFVDLGSGKGRVVMLASLRPWRQVWGVELRERLHRVAEHNLAAFQARGGPVCPVHLFCADASHQPLPAGPRVVFLYNPFPLDQLCVVLARLRRDGAPVRVVYVNPEHGAAVDALGWQVVASHDGGDDPAWAWRVLAPPP